MLRMRETFRSEGSRKGRQRSPAEWADEVARWRRSQLSAARYAAEHNMHPSTLYYWAKKRSGGEVCDNPGVAVPGAFLPVKVAPAAPAICEIVLANGRRVRISGEFDSATVARLLDVAERGGR